MAVITLDRHDSRILQETARSRRIMRWAISASIALHVVAVAVLSRAHLGAPALPREQRLIEVSLERSGAPAVIARPAMPEPAVETPRTWPSIRPKPAVRPGASPGTPAIRVRTPTPRPAAPARALPASPTVIVPRPPVPVPVRAADQPPDRGSASPVSSPPQPGAGSSGPAVAGGGDIGLGAGSRQGDLPGGTGGASGTAPGLGSGSGSGLGPGTGSGQAGGGSGSGAGGGAGDHGGTGGTAAGSSGGGGGGATHVSRLADRKTPVLVRRVNPVYPVAAQVEGVQGKVRLLVTVTKEGAVGAVRVSASSGDSRLDAAAVRAVRRWRYQPAVQDGIPREVETYATVTFSLE